jgi:flavodoxin
MRTVIVYDSLYGNTEKIALMVGEILSGKVVRVIDWEPELFTGTMLLIVGSPIHGWQPTRAIREFMQAVSNRSLQGISIATFDTRFHTIFSGDAAGIITRQLVKCGARRIIAPGNFIIQSKKGPLGDGELEKVRQWANKIKAILRNRK